MRIIRAKHEPYEDGHLGEVARDMLVMGSPTIRVMEIEGVFYALEGSHRLAVAHHYGITPKLVVQIPDAGLYEVSDCDVLAHWLRVAESLPLYKFDEVLILRLEDMIV